MFNFVEAGNKDCVRLEKTECVLSVKAVFITAFSLRVQAIFLTKKARATKGFDFGKS